MPGFSAVEALLPKRTGALLFDTPLPGFGPEASVEAAAPGVPAPHVAPVEPFAPAAPTGVDADKQLAPAAPATFGRPAAWSWTNIALLLWIGGALVLLIRLALVLSNLSLLSRRAEPVTDPEWTELAEVLSEVLDIRRPVRLLRHEEIVVPMTYGVRRPVILLPGHADEWSEDEKHMTLMHELLDAAGRRGRTERQPGRTGENRGTRTRTGRQHGWSPCWCGHGRIDGVSALETRRAP